MSYTKRHVVIVVVNVRAVTIVSPAAPDVMRLYSFSAPPDSLRAVGLGVAELVQSGLDWHSDREIRSQSLYGAMLQSDGPVAPGRAEPRVQASRWLRGLVLGLASLLTVGECSG
jgi:hypothetical protein